MAVPSISVIIPTFNPNAIILKLVIDALKKQSLPIQNWELIVVDNASTNKVLSLALFDWHPRMQLIKEPRQGLTFARLCGFNAAKSELIILVDDDNILENQYLEKALELLTQYPEVGAAGGKVYPLFEIHPPVWTNGLHHLLSVRDLGNEKLISDKTNKVFEYPKYAPFGGGMILRKAALEEYRRKGNGSNQAALIEDRKGEELCSGGDNDIVLHVLESGWRIGYFPQLYLEHFIVAKRLTKSYLSKLAYESNKSWIQVLRMHSICPWRRIPQVTLEFRKLKAYIEYRAWQNEDSYVRWRGACGIFEGLAIPYNQPGAATFVWTVS